MTLNSYSNSWKWSKIAWQLRSCEIPWQHLNRPGWPQWSNGGRSRVQPSQAFGTDILRIFMMKEVQLSFNYNTGKRGLGWVIGKPIPFQCPNFGGTHLGWLQTPQGQCKEFGMRAASPSLNASGSAQSSTGCPLLASLPRLHLARG